MCRSGLTRHNSVYSLIVMGQTRLDLEIERREGELQTLKDIRKLRDGDPELFEQVIGGDMPTRTSAPWNGSTRSMPHADTMKRVYVDNGNMGLTIPDLIKKSGVPKGSVYRVLYKSARKDDFKKRANPQSDLMKLWRLAQEAYEDAQERLAGKEVAR